MNPGHARTCGRCSSLYQRLKGSSAPGTMSTLVTRMTLPSIGLRGDEVAPEARLFGRGRPKSKLRGGRMTVFECPVEQVRPPVGERIREVGPVVVARLREVDLRDKNLGVVKAAGPATKPAGLAMQLRPRKVQPRSMPHWSAHTTNSY
jgi:hypothetical protein